MRNYTEDPLTIITLPYRPTETLEARLDGLERSITDTLADQDRRMDDIDRRLDRLSLVARGMIKKGTRRWQRP